MAVLGMAHPGDGDWSQVRGLQYASLSGSTRNRMFAQATALVVACTILLGKVHIAFIACWVAALGFALYSEMRSALTLSDADRRRLSPEETNRHLRISLAVVMAWVIPFAMFAPFVDSITRLELWAVVGILMAFAAFVTPAVPLSTVLFAAILGIAAGTSFVYQGEYAMAVLALAFSGVIALGAVEVSRNFLRARIAESGVAEKNEVVSLLLREFEEGEADWLWQTDTARRVRSASPRFAFALGKSTADIDGQPFVQLIAGAAWDTGQFPPSLHDLAERLKRRESFGNVLVRVMINGQLRWWELSGTPRLDENGNFDGFRGVGSDVTQQRESSDKIAYMARYDTLTGLPNRMMMTEALAEAMRYAEQWRTRCAFLMIDLDRFKAVNDTLGHLVGDQLLARVSERLKSVISENELCARLGGDEFAVVIRDASDLDRVNRVADTIIDLLSRPYEVDHNTLYVGASVGSALGPRDGSNVETLMRNADLALYRAKDHGGGRHCVYEPTLHAQAEERRRLEFSLRGALEKEEFTLAFQPVVDAIDEQVVSFEALIRWNSSAHGFVSPAKFIPLAEDTRLIVPIGEWVLREACREAMNWPGRIKVAVNVSGEQLLDAGFMPTVVSALAETGLPAQRLEIEVTESIFLRDASTARVALEQIMGLGCGIALDDFGTGYSSLGYIRNLRFSTIKVDRSFVQGAAVGNPESLAIIRAVVAMADSLEMSTTAEGVETEQELSVIRQLGCKKIQGYYFGRPMVADDARALFQTQPLKVGAA